MYEYPALVTASCCDATKHQSLLSTVTMMQDCSQLWIANEPSLTSWMRDEGVAVVLTSRQLDILRKPAAGEKLTVQTGVYSFKGFLGYRNTFIIDEAGEAVAKSWCMGAWIDLATGKIFRIPKEVSESVTYDEKREMDYLPHRISLPTEGFTTLDPVGVKRSMIDYNEHVNNAQYVRMAWDVLPENADPRRMRVEYKAQAHLGDLLYPRLCLTQNDSGSPVYLVNLTDQAETTICIVEFS